jgi:hypothetical protein
MEKDKDLENNHGLMVVIIKDSGKTTRLTGKENFIMPMDLSMKV